MVPCLTLVDTGRQTGGHRRPRPGLVKSHVGQLDTFSFTIFQLTLNFVENGKNGVCLFFHPPHPSPHDNTHRNNQRGCRLSTFDNPGRKRRQWRTIGRANTNFQSSFEWQSNLLLGCSCLPEPPFSTQFFLHKRTSPNLACVTLQRSGIYWSTSSDAEEDYPCGALWFWGKSFKRTMPFQKGLGTLKEKEMYPSK